MVTIVHLAVLTVLIGIEVLYGFLAMLGIILFQFFIGKCISNLRSRVAAVADKRLKLTLDVLSGIRAVKSYGWEQIMYKKILKFKRLLFKLTCPE